MRWQVEELYRELEQLTEIEKCRRRVGCSQRNHIVYCCHAWLSLKIQTQKLGKTIYQVKRQTFDMIISKLNLLNRAFMFLFLPKRLFNNYFQPQINTDERRFLDKKPSNKALESIRIPFICVHLW